MPILKYPRKSCRRHFVLGLKCAAADYSDWSMYVCGIAGIIEQNGIKPPDRPRLDRMLAVLAHRGPDEGGALYTDHAALGHRRLSIIDLESGRQPITNESGQISAVVNGEFYNFLDLRENLLARGHRFRSTGDSECLVHLYEEKGEDCVDDLAGMFAFALWDERLRKLVLVRDRLGVKPLYYAIDKKRILFGSELKAIVAGLGALPPINPRSLADYLTYGFVPSPNTIYEGIFKLPPAEMLTFQNGEIRHRRYWNLTFNGYENSSPDDLAESLWNRLRDSTRARLIADVPIGAFLSGGLDSSAVASAMRDAARGPVSALTIGFNEKGCDETAAARQVATAISADHTAITAGFDPADMLEKLAWHFDEPFADASAAPMFAMSQVARRQFKVMLSGDGGDEALAGYRRYRFDRFESKVRSWLPRPTRRLLGTMGAYWPRTARLPRWLRAGATLRNIATDAATAHAMSVATLESADVDRLLRSDLKGVLGGYDPLDCVRDAFSRCDAPDDLSRSQHADLAVMLADGILTKVDRASMAHGLEVRSPMLDYRFIEFAWRIPPSARIDGNHGKAPLRRALAKRLGSRIAGRAKRGFETPVDHWFRGPLRAGFERILANPAAEIWTLLDRACAESLSQQHDSGDRNIGHALWRIMVLDAWLRMAPSYANPGREHVSGPAEPAIVESGIAS